MDHNLRLSLERGRAEEAVTRATGLAYLVLSTPRLEQCVSFYKDFGLCEVQRDEGAVWLRAFGTAPLSLKLVSGPSASLKAVAVTVVDEQSLRRLASLKEATPVEPHAEPGGGRQVTLQSPGGVAFIAVHGVQAVDAAPLASPVLRNSSGEKVRRGEGRRFPSQPPQVVRLGHVVLGTPVVVQTVGWLMRTFGVLASDYQTLEVDASVPVLCFLRFDRGDKPTDHHSIAVGLSTVERMEHMAFEVDGFDQIEQGAFHLRQRSHKHVWGVGRHLLGSQMFNYWSAPDGMVVEHYTDGDVFDSSATVGRSPFFASALAQWGPMPPADFGVPSMSPELVMETLRALVSSDNDLSIPRLIYTLRALQN